MEIAQIFLNRNFTLKLQKKEEKEVRKIDVKKKEDI